MLANQGKFRDRNPELLAAGKLTAGGDHTTDCIKVEVSNRVNTPDVIKEIRKMTYPGPGEKRVYTGKYTHPDLVTEMRHGIKSRSSENAGSLVTPPPKTFFQQNLIDRQEQVYESKQRKPLGKIPDQSDKLAEGVSILDRFGIKTKKSLSADIVVNPKISRDEVEANTIKGIELYRVSHHHSRVGEQKDLNYNWERVKKTDVFGVETPHNNDGVHVKNSLLWSEDNKNQKTQTLVSKRLDDFKERTQPKLGEVHDPIKDSMRISPDHTFGVMITPDEYGAGDLIHSREANSYLRARDRQRGAVAAIRDHLKKANYHNFHDLREAFNSYDANQSGKIESEELLRVCKGFHLPIDTYLLHDLIKYCDSTNVGKIDYIDFCNFLNWKYELPDEQVKKTQPSTDEGSDTKDADRTRQIDINIGDHQTSSSVINAITGKVQTENYRSFGVPTIRSDLPAPHTKRVGDYTNYGEQSDVYGLINPSIYTTKGLTERDFFQVRSKQDVKHIFDSMKLGYSDADFEKIYTEAGRNDPNSNVSVDSFLQTLKLGPQT